MTRLTELCMRQKESEIEVYKDLEIVSLKWCKEHIPRNGNDFDRRRTNTTGGPRILAGPSNLLMGMSHIEEA